MKKSLLLLTALGASAAAQAQYAGQAKGSPVTVSGTVDVYVNVARGSVIDRSRVESGGNSTSKLIFRGSEDLGGGNYAAFWLEHGIAADNGTTTVLTSTNNQPSGQIPAGTGGAMFNRRSIVALGGGWGELQLGRNWSPTYDSFTSRYDLFGVASGIALNYSGGDNPNFVRVSNSVGYVTPTFFGGLSATAMAWFGENASNTPTKSDGTGEGIKIAYDRGQFSFRTSFARTGFDVGDSILRNVAGFWDPGSFKLSFNLNHDQRGPIKREGWLVGGLVRVGVGEIKATYSTTEANTAGNPEGQKMVVGYVHHLSRRTALYTTFARINNDNGATFAVSGATTAANQSSSGFDLGVRHNF